MDYHRFLYDIGGFCVQIDCLYPFTAMICRDYLAPVGKTPDIAIKCTAEEISEEKQRQTSAFSDGYCESTCIYRKLCNIIPALGGIMFHSSVIEVDGSGYAFFGKSGSGKSTHTRLWMDMLEGRATIVNGDKPIYRFRNGVLTAYGTPWCGKEGYNTNKSVPIKSVCLIVQSKENRIKRLCGAQAAEAMFSQVMLTGDARSVASTMEFLDEMIKAIPVYALECDISRAAAELSYNVMKGINE